LDPLIKSQLLYQLSYAPARSWRGHHEAASFTKAMPDCPPCIQRANANRRALGPAAHDSPAIAGVGGLEATAEPYYSSALPGRLGP
jgi:hypothetical protein